MMKKQSTKVDRSSLELRCYASCFLVNFLDHLGTIICELLLEALIRNSKDLNGKDGRILGPIDGHRGHRDARSIWTVESRASMPFRAVALMGTPMTGSVV